MKVFEKICWIFCAFLLVDQAKAQGFVHNNGQLQNEHGLSNSHVLYYANFGDFRVHLKKNGFSYELLKKQKNQTNLENEDETQVLFDFNRVDIIFENQSFAGIIETENLLFSEKFYRGDNFFEIGRAHV